MRVFIYMFIYMYPYTHTHTDNHICMYMLPHAFLLNQIAGGGGRSTHLLLMGPYITDSSRTAAASVVCCCIRHTRVAVLDSSACRYFARWKGKEVGGFFQRLFPIFFLNVVLYNVRTRLTDLVRIEVSWLVVAALPSRCRASCCCSAASFLRLCILVGILALLAMLPPHWVCVHIFEE